MSSALVIIDVQKGVIESHGSNVFISKINQAIKKARSNRWEVIFSKHINSEAENKKFKELSTQKGSVGSELADGLNIQKDDQVFDKTTYSLFSNSNFERYLKEKNIHKLYLCGISTHVCVLLTSADAFSREYEVVVIKDAVASNNKKKHEIGLWWMKKYTSTTIVLGDI